MGNEDGPTVKDDIYNNIANEIEIADLETALQLYSMDDNAYDDNDYDDDDYDTTTIDKLEEEFKHDLLLLWDTFLSITSHTFVGHQLDHLVRTTTSPQPYKLVGPTSPGGVLYTTTGRVHCGRNHLYKLFGLPLPPPKMTRFNPPRHRLSTGLRHGPRAPNIHLKPLFSCGSRHQPRAPDHLAMELPLIDLQHRYKMF